MNKQSFYLLGGALLASTALTTAGQAAVIKSTNGSNDRSTTAAYAPKTIATELFSATTTTANALTLGSTSSATANSQYFIDFAANLSSGFALQLNVTNAAFNTSSTVTVQVYAQSTSGTLSLSANTTLQGSCAVQPLPDKILITGCTPQGTSILSRADAIQISGIQFLSAGALATAGQTIKMDGTVTDSSKTVTYESITQATIITSASAAEAAIQTSSALTVDNTATPSFSVFVSPAGATATLGTIHFSTTGAVGTDLSNVFGSAASIISTSELKITHSLLSDPALVSISVGVNGVTAKTLLDFVSGTVSFQVPAISLNGAAITAIFNGTGAILASSGTNTAVYTPTIKGTLTAKAVAAFSGALSTITRGGLSVELNTLQPTAGAGSTLYRSYLRIANQSATDGVATVTVKNDSTGALIGSFTTTITAGGTRQIGADTIEANISTAAATGAMYKVLVTGSFNGYVQNLMWNSVTGIFTDLSGFRNGALTLDP